MRIRNCLFLCFLVLFGTSPAPAQRQAQIPEYVGHVSAVVDGASVPLERQNPQMDAKMRGFGLGGMRTRYIVNGDRSAVRFRQNQNISFILRVVSQDVDPTASLRLLPITPRKGRRELDYMTTGFGGLTGARDRINERAIVVQAQRLGRNAFRISTNGPLQIGEYAIISGESQILNLFAID